MAFIHELETEALAQLDLIREARVYQGDNPDYKARAKIALGVIGSYVRLRATMANERTNELVTQRLMISARAPLSLIDGRDGERLDP